MESHTTEIIIQGSEVMARDVFMRPLGNIDKLIKETMDQPEPKFIDVSLPPMMNKWVLGHILGESENGKQLFLVTEIEYFPMEGVRLTNQRQEGVEYYPVYPGQLSQEQVRSGQFPLIEGERWNFPDNYRGFIFQAYNKESNRINNTSPQCFFIDKDNGDPFIFNLPNVFEDGAICTGDDYRNRNDSEISQTSRLPFHHLKHGLNVLHEAPPNSDLDYRELDGMLRWDHEGKQIPKDIESCRRFKTPCTIGRVVAFAKWLKGVS